MNCAWVLTILGDKMFKNRRPDSLRIEKFCILAAEKICYNMCVWIVFFLFGLLSTTRLIYFIVVFLCSKYL